MLDKAAFLDFVVESVRRTDEEFTILPKRWVVERTFGWLTRYRRLVRDYEARIDVSKAMIYAGMGSSILRRIVHLLSFQTDSKSGKSRPSLTMVTGAPGIQPNSCSVARGSWKMAHAPMIASLCIYSKNSF